MTASSLEASGKREILRWGASFLFVVAVHGAAAFALFVERERGEISDASEAVVMRKEGERLLERLPTSARLVLCDPGGDAMDSRAFAAMLQQQRERAQDVAFVLGGAHGIGDVVRERPHRRLAMAPWTLPHELARLVLAEQLYRAGTIGRNEPYHK